jgi:hypothetical protein
MYLWANTLTAHQRYVIPNELTLRLDFSHQQPRDARIPYDKLPTLDPTPFNAVRILNRSDGLGIALHRAGILGSG